MATWEDSPRHIQLGESREPRKECVQRRIDPGGVHILDSCPSPPKGTSNFGAPAWSKSYSFFLSFGPASKVPKLTHYGVV